MAVDPNDDRIQPYEELPDDSTQLDNFAAGEIKTASYTNLQTGESEDKVLWDLQHNPVDADYVPHEIPFLASDKSNITERYLNKETPIDIPDDPYDEDKTPEENAERHIFARQGYPLIMKIKKGGAKILIWDLGVPDYDNWCSNGYLNAYTINWVNVLNRIQAVEGKEEYSFDYAVGQSGLTGVWGQCPASMPDEPIIDFDPNNWDTDAEPPGTGYWTGDINDYKAVVWFLPASNYTCYLKTFSCYPDVTATSDSRFVNNPLPIWWTQIKNEGYTGKVILQGAANSLVGGSSYYAEINKYINELASNIGSNIAIDATVRAWSDNWLYHGSCLSGNVATTHPLMLNITSYPHLNTAPTTGGTPLIYNSIDYKEDWCNIFQDNVGGSNQVAIETITKNEKNFYFIVAAAWLTHWGSSYTSAAQIANQTQLWLNLYDVEVPQP